MSDYCVVVADAVRARLFTLEPANVPEAESGPKLSEVKCLVNPEKELPRRAVFTENKSGGNRSRGASNHSFDDHRSKHELEFEKQFARKVAAEAGKTLKAEKARQLVLIADSRMLGLLRKEIGAQVKLGVEVSDLDRDMTKLTPAEIQAHLAKAGLVPACCKPSGPRKRR